MILDENLRIAKSLPGDKTGLDANTSREKKRNEVKMITQEAVKRMTQRIIEKFSPEKIIIFGSWAKNLAGQESDIDFLVVMPFIGSKRDAQVSIRRDLKDFEEPKDVIVVSPEELEQKKALNGYIKNDNRDLLAAFLDGFHR
ncbi:MAG: nucleotidyltransferase domain-containing protein [Bacillota bacterium]